jgi:hypothetical protein
VRCGARVRATCAGEPQPTDRERDREPSNQRPACSG